MQLVGHLTQRVELHVDLALTGGGDLVVVRLDLDADRLQRHAPSRVRRSVSVSVGATGK